MNMILDDERSYELRIPDFNLFPSMPPLSPQSSMECAFDKQENPFQCKKESGRILWSPCTCWACEQKIDLEKKDADDKMISDICYDKMSFLFPPEPEVSLPPKDDYFKDSLLGNLEDKLPVDDYFAAPDLNYFRDSFMDDLPRSNRETLVPFKNRRRQKPLRENLRALDDDEDFVVPKSYSNQSTVKTNNKRKISGTRCKYTEEAKKRKYNIMEHFAKGNRSRSETGYLGVRISTSGRRFRATVNYLGKPQNVGTFDTPEEAAMEYDKKLLELSGWQIDKNRLNFCDRWNLREKRMVSGSEHLRKRRKIDTSP